ncbi:MAG: hypothetical protein HFJ08_02665 [Lachnospiraceae bacterium]|nr:hypothetical protein [Lachnospiraceae bacterium]
MYLTKTEAISCFVVNPILKDSSKLYIYGTSREAARLFFHLCSLRIFVEGFVDESEESNITFFHKPVYGLSDLPNEDNVKILSLNKKHPNVVTLDCVLEVNDDIDKDNIIIYGAGNVGRELNKYLETIDIHIKCFIETSSDKIGSRIDGVPVYGKETLKEFSNETTIIEAGKYWRDIDKIVQQLTKMKRFYVSGMAMLNIMTQKDEICIDCEKSAIVKCPGIVYMASLEKQFPNKEFLVFGTDNALLEKYVEVYNLLGYRDFTIVTEKNLSDITNIDEYIILVQNINRVDALKKLGLSEVENYVPVFSPDISIYSREICWDINLGHTYKSDDGDFGLKTYGNNNKDDYKIVILGNSTSECGRNRFSSWVQVLFEQHLKDYKITVYNCAVSGYTSTQELIKLLRDGMKLSPNMILTYSGVTDSIFERYSEMSTYAFPMANKIFHKNADGRRIVNGLVSEENTADKWLFNMRCMNAIAEMCGIVFIAFAQPSLASKKYLTINEKMIIKMQKIVYPEKVFFAVEQFRKAVPEMEKVYTFIHDFSEIFDFREVYMDLSHVNAEGHQIIADKIWNKIKNYIQQSICIK